MPTAARQVKVKAKGAAVQEPKSNAAAAPVIPITAVKNFGFSVAPKATITTGISLAARAPSILVSPVVEAEREIDAKYAQLDGVGRYNHFQGGSIYWTPGTGAHEVHGAIKDKWASMGWERSFLGYPVTDETGTPDGVGRYNHFQGGSIYWTPSIGAYEVHGAI